MLGAVQRLGLLINDLSRNTIVFNLGVAVCEAPTLLFPIPVRLSWTPKMGQLAKVEACP